jgi:hypothetical protein
MPPKKDKKVKKDKKEKKVKQKQKQSQVVNVNIGSTKKTSKKQPSKGSNKESTKESKRQPNNIIVNVAGPTNNPVRESVKETVKETRRSPDNALVNAVRIVENPLVPPVTPVEVPDLINFDEPIREEPSAFENQQPISSLVEPAPIFEEPSAPVFEEPSAPAFEESSAPVFEEPSAPVFEEPSAPAFEEEPIVSFADIYKNNDSLDNFSDVNKNNNGFLNVYDTTDAVMKKINALKESTKEQEMENTSSLSYEDDIDDNDNSLPPMFQREYDGATIDMLSNGDLGLTTSGKVREIPTGKQFKFLSLELQEYFINKKLAKMSKK